MGWRLLGRGRWRVGGGGRGLAVAGRSAAVTPHRATAARPRISAPSPESLARRRGGRLELDGVVAVEEVEIDAVGDLLDARRLLVRLVLEDQLLEEVEGALVVHLRQLCRAGGDDVA